VEVVAFTSRRVFVGDVEPCDVTASNFLNRFVVECANEDEKDLIRDARSQYLRVGIGGDMEFVLSDFLRPLPVGKIDRGERFLSNFVNRFIRGVKVLSFEDAVGFMTETTTSPGWPYTECGIHTRKTALDSGAIQWAREFEESGLHGVWTGCLKGEVLKRVKYEAGHTRFFACCPIHTQLVLLRYCAVFNALVIQWSKEEKWPFYVGRSPYMGGWNRMCQELNEFGEVFSLDEKLWDTTLSRDLFRVLYRVRNSAFEECLSDDKIEWLVDEVVATYIVTDTGELIRKYQGNASGAPNTLIDNSLILLLLYFEAYAREYPDDSMDDFFINVRLNIIGDDNICAVSPERSRFGKDSVMRVMAEWGINPRVESVTPSIVDAHYVAKNVGVHEYAGKSYYVPLPDRKRLLAHYLYSTPGENVLLSAIKCNSLLVEVVFDDLLWKMLYKFQSWYLDLKEDMYRWCTADLSLTQFDKGIICRKSLIIFHLGLECEISTDIKSNFNEFKSKLRTRINMPNKKVSGGAKAGGRGTRWVKRSANPSAKTAGATSSNGDNTSRSVALAKSYYKRSTRPSFKSNGSTVTVRHREFVGDMISSGGAFELDALRINPANRNLFPWLARIAVNYESYEFKFLCFEYVPTVAATTGGGLAMMVDFDATDESPADKETMLNSKDGTSDVIWRHQTLPVKKDDVLTLGKRRYTLRDNAYADDSVSYPLNTDARAFDVGYFNIAQYGTPAGTMGELRISYVVDLITPQLFKEPTIVDLSAKIVNDAKDVSKNEPFGAIPTITGGLVKSAVKYIENKAWIALPKVFDGIVNAVFAGTNVAAPNVVVVNDSGATIPGLVTTVMNNTQSGTTNRTIQYGFRYESEKPAWLTMDTTGSTTITGATAWISPFASEI